MVTPNKLEWAAGFLEAEGCFHYKRGGQLTVSAAQVKDGSLEQLQGIFGGKIYRKNDQHGPTSACRVWMVTNQKAAEVSMTMFCLMSPKRQGEIKVGLDQWKTKRNRRFATSCIKGHPLSGENLYLHGGKRYCRQCRSYGEQVLRGWRTPEWNNRRPGEECNFQCKRGHVLIEGNLYHWNGKRYCLECKNLRNRNRYLNRETA